MTELSDEQVFGHHQPLTIDYLEGRVLTGHEGCYRNRLLEEELDVEGEVYAALAVQQSSLGEEEGCRLLKVGKVAPGTLNTKDIWPEADQAKLTVLPFDVSEFPAVNGLMTSGFVELPIKIKIKEGDQWRTVKEGERAGRGYGALVMKLFMWPKSTAGGEYMVTCLPVSLAEVGTLGGLARSRSYPGIKVHKGKFKFSNPELPGMNFGLGNLPFIVVSGLDWEEGEDGVDLTNINWMSSMNIKTAVSNTLAEAVVPNWHNKAARWREASQKGKFVKQVPSSLWPAPVMEDDQQTEPEQGSESEDDEDMPEARNDDDLSEEDGNLTDDIPNNTREIREGVIGELGRRKKRPEVQESLSPLKRRESRTLKRKEGPVPKVAEKNKKGREEAVQAKKNSDMFPADVRPDIFRKDEVFNALTFDKASTFVHEHGLLQAKIKMKNASKNSQEKADDKLKEVEVTAGLDDAQDKLNEVARNLRPVNKEIGDQMKWKVTEWKEVVRNLPLEVYGLADSVATKPIELCHNLASNLTIDMFCPGGKRAVNTKQKTCRTKDGELAVETSEVYGDLESVQDVLLAWNTLAAIWQKTFPEWPAAQIALRVIMKMKMFAHCINRNGSSDAKEVLISFSNRFLTSNSKNAASKKGPLSYERAKNLAGNVCVDRGHPREPLLGAGHAAAEGRADQRGRHQGGLQAGQGGLQGGRQGGHQDGRGGRGGYGGASRGGGSTGARRPAVKMGGETLCHFYQEGSCRDQAKRGCVRASGNMKHACAFVKSSGNVCGSDHTKQEHDVSKHGS